MKTFSEAFEEMVKLPKHIEPETQEAIDFTIPQQEFGCEVAQHPAMGTLATTAVLTIVAAISELNGGKVDAPTVAHEAYINGVILGVAIGIRMEKRDDLSTL